MNGAYLIATTPRYMGDESEFWLQLRLLALFPISIQLVLATADHASSIKLKHCVCNKKKHFLSMTEMMRILFDSGSPR